MAEERLEIILEADVAKASAEIDKFSANLGKTLPAATAKAAQGIDKMAKASSSAVPTLTNFSRVVQDAPFGIMGIANNIDPLIQSFQALQKSTKETGGAAKALFAGLAGPAGIAVGVSIVTSALIKFGPAIGKAITGVSELDATMRDAAGKGAEAFSKANSEFSNFLRIATDSGNSLARQNDALADANKLLSGYGLQINSLSEFQKKGAQIGAIYAQIKQEEARSSVLAAKAAEEYAKRVALTVKAQQGDAIGIFGDLSFGDKLKTIFGGVGAGANFIKGYSNAITDAAQSEDLYNKENQKTQQNISNLIKQMGDIPGVSERFGKAVASASTEAANSLDRLFASIGTFTTGQKMATVVTDAETAALLALSAAADKAFQSKQQQALADKAKAIQGAAGPVALPKRGIDPQITQIQDNFRMLQENAMETASILGNTLGPAIDNVFNALANGDNVFKALGDAVKGLVVELVKAVAKALILQAIMSVITGGGSAAAGATTGGGGFLKKLLGGVLGGRAGGGMVSPGGGYIVGENGPEKFYPAQAGMIVPNGGGAGGSLSARISGNSLLFLLKQAGNNNKMNFG